MKIKSEPIPALAHQMRVKEARRALKAVAAKYAENVRKCIPGIVDDAKDLPGVIYDTIWDDEHPGDLPVEFDTLLVRKEMERLVLKAFKVK